MFIVRLCKSFHFNYLNIRLTISLLGADGLSLIRANHLKWLVCDLFILENHDFHWLERGIVHASVCVMSLSYPALFPPSTVDWLYC